MTVTIKPHQFEKEQLLNSRKEAPEHIYLLVFWVGSRAQSVIERIHTNKAKKFIPMCSELREGVLPIFYHLFKALALLTWSNELGEQSFASYGRHQKKLAYQNGGERR